MIRQRNFWMMLLLTFVTCGIYGIYWWYCLTEDMNQICDGRSSGKPSMNYILVILLTIVTCGIYYYIWVYQQGNRMAEAAPTYGVNIQENGTSLLLWMLLGALVCGIGQYVGVYLWTRNMNLLADAYNQANYGSSYGNM